ncbi:MAG: hypothetical protein U0935_12910 [Pirellulales bacterium]
MTGFQRLCLSLFPRRWRRSVIRESRRWRMACPHCSYSVSYWKIGGIRWRAASYGKRVFRRCPACRRTGWWAVYWQEHRSAATPPEDSSSSG